MSKPAPIKAVTMFCVHGDDYYRVTYHSGRKTIHSRTNLPANAISFIVAATTQTSLRAADGIEELTFTKEV